MRKVCFVLIALTMLLLVGCYGKVSIPDLIVSCNESEILVSRGGCDWTNNTGPFTKEGIKFTSPTSDKLVEDIDGNKVKPETELTLAFSKKPKNVKVIPWGAGKDKKFTFTSNKIIVPKEEGNYIYEVVGGWKQGYVSYTIKVIVTDE